MKRATLLATVFCAASIVATSSAQAADTPDQAAIKKILNDGCAAFVNGDSKGAISLYLSNYPKFMVFDIAPPREKNYDQVKAFNDQMLAATDGKPTCVYEEINPVILTPTYAYSTAILHSTGKLKNGSSFDFRERATDVWKKVKGEWKVMHEHNSVPVDVMTGKADLTVAP